MSSFSRSLTAFRLAAEFAKFFLLHFTPSGDAWDGSPNDPRLATGSRSLSASGGLSAPAGPRLNPFFTL